MPAGWVHSRLDDSALLLVDGVDELAPRQRQKVRRWLRDLRNSHPELPIVVTARPSAAASRGSPTSGSNWCCWSRWTIRCHRMVSAIQAALRVEQLTQPPAVAAAYAATARSLIGVITTFNTEIATLDEQVQACFGQARDAEVYRSQPGLGPVLAARVLGEFGDDPDRYATAKHRKNYAGTSPITRQSGKKPCWPASSTTTGWSTPYTSWPSAPCGPHQAPAPTTTNSAAEA
jgi:transposase IS116/IS110/IS902 family protein